MAHHGVEPGSPGASTRRRPASPERAGEAFARLVAVMDRLRSPGGCPWDAEQTHASLAPYAIEEAYEVADAAERGDPAHLADELGDLLLQVVFHARVGEEHADAPFDVEDVITGLVAKLERRHPHVFGDVAVADAREVTANWERIKESEQADSKRASGVPLGLPALVRAQKVLRRAHRAGVTGPTTQDDDGPTTQDDDGPTTQDDDGAAPLGLRLLALVAEAEAAGQDAESELRRATAEHERVLGG